MAPPKAKTEAASTDELVALFKSFGLTQAKAAEAAKNPKSANVLKQLVEDSKYGVSGKTLDEKQAVLISSFASQLAKTNLGDAERTYVISAVLDGRLKSTDQITGTQNSHLPLLIPLKHIHSCNQVS
jgi:glutaminyl-tRNA synthetase